MTICYLDPEDEITGAVARIRAVEDGQAVIVLPSGSRIATSRINFRLLAREAEHKGLIIVAVSDEPGVRALAVSAGLPAYDSVSSAEAGLAEFARQDRRLAERLGATPGRPAAAPRDQSRPVSHAPVVPPRAAPGPPRHAPGGPSANRSREPSEGTRVMAVPLPGELPRGDQARRPERELPARGRGPRDHSSLRDAPSPATVGAQGEPIDDRYGRRQGRRRGNLAPLVVIALLVALVGAAAVGAYTLLPTATVTIRPHLSTVGPVSATVVADPRVAVVDAGEGVVPAQRIELPLSATGEFEASGRRVSTVRASGTVRFNSANTLSEVEIPAGTRVRTAGGLAFETTEGVVVPRAVFDTGTPGLVDAPVRAVQAGRRGNVAADAISEVPPELREQLVRVTNPQPTTGGDRREATVVAAADYASAVLSLVEQLDDRLALALADPETTPRGLTAYPGSARIGEPAAVPAADAVVGTVAESFSLTVNATAGVVAVNESLVDQVGADQLRALVPPGSTLLDQTMEVSHSPGEVSGTTIVYSVAASGRSHRLLDRDALVAEIRGRTVDEARAIIDLYGSAELSVWPEFIDRLPDQPARINVTILVPTENV